MKKIVLLMIFFVNLTLVSAVNDTFQILKEKYDVKEGEYLALIFIDPGECDKCLSIPYTQLECISQSINRKTLQFTAIVKVDREIELIMFKKNYNWNYDCEVDRDFQKKLELKEGISMAIFDSKGNIISQMTLQEVRCDRIQKDLKENISK